MLKDRLTLPYDVQAVRSDFPILAQAHHEGVPLVYLDNAATSQKPLAVIDAIDTYYREYNANVHRGIHKLSEAASEAYEAVRGKVRRFINAASRREIVFVRGTTEGINLVAQTWGRANLRAGDAVLLSQMEHHANIVPWQMLAAETGVHVLYAPITADGLLDMDTYARLLREHPVKLVAVTWVSNVLGTVNPVAELARLAHEAGALILLDAAQAAPHLPVDVRAVDADFLTFSGHKMCGPTGSGVLYGKAALLDAMPPWMGGGDMISRVTFDGSTWNDIPFKFEAGTPLIAEQIGLGAAIDYLNALGMDSVHQHEQAMTRYALERLGDLPWVRVFGPEAAHKGAVAAFTVERVHAHDVAQVLDSQGIAVRAGHHCAQPLHGLLGVSATARASFYLYNSPAEIDLLIDGLQVVSKTFAL
jgi:cysteine desulfurase/selenocysteine lyase